MLDLKWSPSEKKIARAAFDAALSREDSAIRGRVEAMLRASTDPAEIWRVRDYLDEKRASSIRSTTFAIQFSSAYLRSSWQKAGSTSRSL